jgi:hypothetical protein
MQAAAEQMQSWFVLDAVGGSSSPSFDFGYWER